MIHLITGLPGSGKTLYALNYIESMKGAREVYYSGIKDLMLPYVLLDNPEQWNQLPIGSIILIDEAQTVFRPRGVGSKVPDFVQALETHRHKGFDIILITQHPMLIDTNVRKLVGRHLHVVRTFGLERATVHEWSQAKENCSTSRADSIKHLFGYPVASYLWYKSAEVHTHKRRLPVRLLVIIFLPIAFLMVGYAGWQIYDKSQHRVPASSSPALPGSSSSSGVISRLGARPVGAPETLAEYAAAREPRVWQFPHTAPIYAELVKPKSFPFPAACVQSPRSGCTCYSQQGTKMLQVGSDLCSTIVREGFFMDWATPTITEAVPVRPALAGGAVGLLPAVPAIIPPFVPAKQDNATIVTEDAGSQPRQYIPTSKGLPKPKP